MASAQQGWCQQPIAAITSGWMSRLVSEAVLRTDTKSGAWADMWRSSRISFERLCCDATPTPASVGRSPRSKVLQLLAYRLVLLIFLPYLKKMYGNGIMATVRKASNEVAH